MEFLSFLRDPSWFTVFSFPRVEAILRSSRGAVSLMLDPIPDKTWAKYDAEIVIFAVDQIEQRWAIQFLQVREIQLRPKPALGRRVHQLVEIG